MTSRERTLLRRSEIGSKLTLPLPTMLASLHAGTCRKRSLLGLRYRRSRPDGDHVSQCVDPWGGPHRDRNLGRDWGVDLVHWLGPPLCRVGAAMNVAGTKTSAKEKIDDAAARQAAGRLY